MVGSIWQDVGKYTVGLGNRKTHYLLLIGAAEQWRKRLGTANRAGAKGCRSARRVPSSGVVRELAVGHGCETERGNNGEVGRGSADV
jgi:hypothetical protein